ncbi:MAG: hypothetical protein WBN03_13970, partial [Desulfobacterales bacterium]
MKGTRFFVTLAAVLVLGACVTMPTGPSVMVLPSAGKSFEVFQSEDLACRNWAALQTGATPAGVVNQNLTGGAAIGALMGAGLGAAIGAASGNAGAGAAIGAGSGLIGGAAVASGPAYAAGWDVQQRYDNAYQQCMYAKGNQIPGILSASRSSASIPPPPPPGYYSGSAYPPPPPSGSYSGSTYPPPSGVY